jgi:hypothetical protein
MRTSYDDESDIAKISLRTANESGGDWRDLAHEGWMDAAISVGAPVPNDESTID